MVVSSEETYINSEKSTLVYQTICKKSFLWEDQRNKGLNIFHLM